MTILIGNTDKHHRILQRLKYSLRKHNIEFKTVKPRNKVLWARDVFVKINNKYIVCNLTDKSTMNKDRSNEYQHVLPILEEYTSKTDNDNRNYKTNREIILLPKKIKMEGGDILQYGHFIFVGINKRTNMYAVDFLKETFPKKIIIPIKHTALHLDCVFCVLDGKEILYDSKYIRHLPSSITANNFRVSDVSEIADSGKYLDLNFLKIGKTIFTADTPETINVRNLLQQVFKYTVITIKMDDIWKEGGSIHCLTQKLN